MDELERRLRETLEGRADDLGRPRPLPLESTRRVGRRRRFTTGVAVALVVLVAATTAFALRRPDADQQVAAGGGGAACYPDGLPPQLADQARQTAWNAKPIPGGGPPAARFVRPSATSSPAATWPADAIDGYLIEVSGFDFSNLVRQPAGTPIGTYSSAEFEYTANLRPVGGGFSDHPFDLESVGPVTAISLDASCGGDTATTINSMTGRDLPPFTGSVASADQLWDFGAILAGLTLDQAELVAEHGGWQIRVIQIDGAEQTVQGDLISNRLDVATTNGVIAGPVTAG